VGAATEYMLPGLWVREEHVDVPLDWNDDASPRISLLVRELVDPDRRHDDLPLLAYLQGGPGGASPRPVSSAAVPWIAEALTHYRVVLVDQRGTGGSSPVDAREVAAMGDGEAGADYLSCFRADSIVRDLEHVRATVHGGRKWATLAQSYGGWITLTYLSLAPEGLSACYVCGGMAGVPPSAERVYRRTFARVEARTEEYYRRFPGDRETVGAIADALDEGDVRLPDGDRLTVHRFQSTGLDLGMGAGMVRMHWTVENAFTPSGRLSEGFRADVLARTSSATNPLFWTLQESIYGDGANGPLAWSAQRERDRLPQFDTARRPLLFTGEMAFPWMFDEVRLLRGFGPAVHALAARTRWSRLYDLDRLAANDVPVAAVVYYDDMFVDSGLQLETVSRVGNARAWVTNEYEHDGIGSERTFPRLREMVRDRGGELR